LPFLSHRSSPPDRTTTAEAPRAQVSTPQPYGLEDLGTSERAQTKAAEAP
jgi:hypothetical protein